MTDQPAEHTPFSRPRLATATVPAGRLKWRETDADDPGSGPSKRPLEEGNLDGVAAASAANAAGQVMAQMQVFALKQATNVQAATVATLLQSLPQGGSISPPHLGNSVDATA